MTVLTAKEAMELSAGSAIRIHKERGDGIRSRIISAARSAQTSATFDELTDEERAELIAVGYKVTSSFWNGDVTVSWGP